MSAPDPLPWMLPFEWADEIDQGDLGLEEIVSGVLTSGGMSMVYGDSNSGKTYLVMHLGLCIASGLPWLGREVKQGIVIYVACESAMSIRRRYVAHCRHFGRAVRGFGIVPSTVNLMDPSADVDMLVDLIKQRMFECCPDHVQLVVIDTLARAMAGGNENAGEDMSRLVHGVDRIREETGAHVLLIHHSGKNQAMGARGHSSLRAALDTELEVTGDDSNIHVARVTKQRDLATKGLRLAGRFVSVDLGLDQWGKSVTACAVEDVSAADVPARQRAPQSSQSSREVLAYLLGQKAAVRMSVVVEALKGAVSRTSVYRAIGDLVDEGRVTNMSGLIYAIKGQQEP